MHLQGFIRMIGNTALPGSIVYVFGPDILLHYWPALRVADACALADPLAVMAGIGGACFSVSSLALHPGTGEGWMRASASRPPVPGTLVSSPPIRKAP